MKTIFKAFLLLYFCSTGINAQTGNYSYSSDINIRFLEAASIGDYTVVADCLKKGVNVNTATWDGVTALMYATLSGDKRIVKLLLEKGANVNAQPTNGLTALITASQFGFTEITEMLLADSAKTDIADLSGATALHYASLYNNDTIVFMLLGAGANENVFTKNNETPLALASLNGSYEAAYLLCDAGADINSKDKSGFTPLMLASQAGSQPLVELLLNNGAAVNLQNNTGFSALSLAILNKHPHVVKILLDNGANAKEANSISLNAPSLAKISGDTAIKFQIKQTGAKRNFFPAFITAGAGAEFNINSGSLVTGLFVTQHDLKYNLVYNLGFSFRPYAHTIDFTIPDYGFYQFRERRYMINFDLGKNISFNHKNSAGINIGGRLLYTFGKYKSTNIPINGGIKAAPQAWFYLNIENFELRTGYHYSDYGEKNLKKSHLTIGLVYNFNNFNYQKFNKRLKWLE